MTRKVRHLIKFEKEDGIFVDIDDSEIENEIKKRLPEEVEIERCYSEYPKPYGHRPYVSVVTEDGITMVSEPRERTRSICSAVEGGTLAVVDGTIDEKIDEGWA